MRYQTGDGPAVCVSADGGGTAYDVAALQADLPLDPVTLASDDDGRRRLRDALTDPPVSARRDISAERLLAPVPRPGKVIGIGLNYRDHAEETGDAIPERPVVFAKWASSVTGPYDEIAYPPESSRLDYEAELGVVIGRRCRHVAQADAAQVIAGYVVLDDVSARDVQNATSQWTLGKSFDTFCPLGPALVTADEVPDPQALDIALWVNDEQRQSSNTKNMIFGVYDLIARLSAVGTLEPGDVIATGTPGGVGIGFTPERLLSVGDEIRVTIEGLGTIRNRVVAASRP